MSGFSADGELSADDALSAWRKRLRRFGQSGLTVARFCGQERISVASFYYWRRKLQPETVRGAAGGGSGRGRREVFRPVSVVAPTVSPARLTVLLPGGTRVEVAAGDLEALGAVMAAVARADRDLQERGRSC